MGTRVGRAPICASAAGHHAQGERARRARPGRALHVDAATAAAQRGGHVRGVPLERRAAICCSALTHHRARGQPIEWRPERSPQRRNNSWRAVRSRSSAAGGGTDRFCRRNEVERRCSRSDENGNVTLQWHGHVERRGNANAPLSLGGATVTSPRSPAAHARVSSGGENRYTSPSPARSDLGGTLGRSGSVPRERFRLQ